MPPLPLDPVLFLIFAGIAVLSAVSLVLQKHPIASALSLVGVMVSLAALYLLLGAEFIAAAQLVVYAGAIMVLFLFVIMLMNLNKTAEPQKNKWLKLAGGVAGGGRSDWVAAGAEAVTGGVGVGTGAGEALRSSFTTSLRRCWLATTT